MFHIIFFIRCKCTKLKMRLPRSSRTKCAVKCVHFARYRGSLCWRVWNVVSLDWSKLLQTFVHRLFVFSSQACFVFLCSQHQLPHLPWPAKIVRVALSSFFEGVVWFQPIACAAFLGISYDEWAHFHAGAIYEVALEMHFTRSFCGIWKDPVYILSMRNGPL